MIPVLIEGTLYLIKDKDIERVRKADKKDWETRNTHNPYYTYNRDKILEDIQKRYKPKMNI